MCPQYTQSSPHPKLTQYSFLVLVHLSLTPRHLAQGRKISLRNFVLSELLIHYFHHPRELR